MHGDSTDEVFMDYYTILTFVSGAKGNPGVLGSKGKHKTLYNRLHVISLRYFTCTQSATTIIIIIMAPFLSLQEAKEKVASKDLKVSSLN